MWDSSLLDNNQSEPATKANQKISECVIHYISPGLPNKRLAEDISLRLAGVILFFHFLKQSHLSRHSCQVITFWGGICIC